MKFPLVSFFYQIPLLLAALLSAHRALGFAGRTDTATRTRYSPVAAFSLETTLIPGNLAATFHAGMVRGSGSLWGGPVVSIRNGGLTYFDGPRLCGFNLAWRFFPNPPGRRFDLFFQAETIFLRFRHRAGGADWQTGLLLSYGLRVRLGCDLFLFQNSGLGYGYGRAGGLGSGTSFPGTGLRGNFRLGISKGF
jgi:hypothetical protein